MSACRKNHSLTQKKNEQTAREEVERGDRATRDEEEKIRRKEQRAVWVATV